MRVSRAEAKDRNYCKEFGIRKITRKKKGTVNKKEITVQLWRTVSKKFSLGRVKKGDYGFFSLGVLEGVARKEGDFPLKTELKCQNPLSKIELRNQVLREGPLAMKS